MTNPFPPTIEIKAHYFICGNCRHGHDNNEYVDGSTPVPNDVSPEAWSAALNGLNRGCMITSPFTVHMLALSIDELLKRKAD